MDVDEQRLIQRCFSQDKSAWNEFVEKYSRLIYNYIYCILRIKGVSSSLDTVNDLFQDTFLSLIKDNFRKLRQFKGRNNASLASWIRIITINFCLDYLKKKKNLTLSLDEDYQDEGFSLKDILPARCISANEHLIGRERLEHLSECIDTLDTQDKYFLEMHIYRGMNLKDIQVSLGLSRSAVDMRKSRLIQKLRACFEDKGFRLDS